MSSHVIPIAMKPVFNEIRSKFGLVLFEVRNAILKKPPPLEDVKMLLEGTYVELKPQIAHATTINEVIKIVQDKCTLIDISYLEIIVKAFDIQEAKSHIDEYKSAKDQFCKTVSVHLCLDQSFKEANTSSSLRCETATFTLDWEPENCVINDIKEILSECFQKLSIYVQVEIIKKTNSIEVVCTFPLSLAVLLIAKAHETIDHIKKRGLIRLKIGHCLIYDKRKTDKV